MLGPTPSCPGAEHRLGAQGGFVALPCPRPTPSWASPCPGSAGGPLLPHPTPAQGLPPPWGGPSPCLLPFLELETRRTSSSRRLPRPQSGRLQSGAASPASLAWCLCRISASGSGVVCSALGSWWSSGRWRSSPPNPPLAWRPRLHSGLLASGWAGPRALAGGGVLGATLSPPACRRVAGAAEGRGAGPRTLLPARPRGLRLGLCCPHAPRGSESSSLSAPGFGAHRGTVLLDDGDLLHLVPRPGQAH